VPFHHGPSTHDPADEPADTVAIGRHNMLRVNREVDFGYYLDGGDLGEILLPNSMAPQGVDNLVGSSLRVFIYRDSEDRLVATTWPPLAEVGDTAVLRVTDVTPVGAFLDWGLPKDLLAPFKEQNPRMHAGKSYLVHVYLDEQTGRVAATNRLGRFLGKTRPPMRPGDEVDLLIGHPTDLGYTALIEGKYLGLIFHSEIFTQLTPGEHCRGYIKNIRPDGKVDLSLKKPGHNPIPDLADRILADLAANDGFLPLNDATPPLTIYLRFGVSKKVFKKSIGTLYKARRILIEEGGIRLARR